MSVILLGSLVLARSPRGFFVAALGLLLTAPLGGQQTPVRDSGAAPRWIGTASLSGNVLNDVTGQPLRRAVVTISSSERGLRLSSVTDDAGRFSFDELPEGRYLVSAAKAGFVSTNLGASRPQRPGTALTVASGERKAGVTLRMPPGAVISGTVRNRLGEPVSDARVSVLRPTVSYLNGERTLGPAGAGGFGEATDDRGEFRVFGLAAGDYYVVASVGIGIRNNAELRETTTAEIDWAMRQLQSPSGAQAPGFGRAVDFAPVFYPGVPTQAAASVITLNAGEERRGVDVLLDLTPTAKITGTVVSPIGELPPGLQVNIIAHETIPGIPFSGFGNARVDASGRFVSAGLPPADYTVTVRAAQGRGGAPNAALFGIATVTVNGADVDTTVTLGSGSTVSGRVTFDAHTLKPPADLTRVRVNLAPANRGRTPTLGVAAAIADASGIFKFVGVTPGRYRIEASGVGGWFVRSATIDGRDVLDDAIEITSGDVTGVEVTFSDLQTELTGDLLDSSGKPATEYYVIVYPANKEYWVPMSRRILSTRPGSDGHFKFLNLPAGDYLIAAVTDVEQGEWYDPAFLAQLVGASTKVTLAEGEKKVQSLRIKGGHQ